MEYVEKILVNSERDYRRLGIYGGKKGTVVVAVIVGFNRFYEGFNFSSLLLSSPRNEI